MVSPKAGTHTYEDAGSTPAPTSGTFATNQPANNAGTKADNQPANRAFFLATTGQITAPAATATIAIRYVPAPSIARLPYDTRVPFVHSFS
jgi:hypothetical protein